MKKTILTLLITAATLFAGHLQAQIIVGPVNTSCNTSLQYLFNPAIGSDCSQIDWIVTYPDGNVVPYSGTGITISSGDMIGQMVISVIATNCNATIFNNGIPVPNPQSSTIVTNVNGQQLSTPSSITGPHALCNGNTASYTVSPVSGADSYTFSVPGGWSINGQIRRSFTVYNTRTVTIGSPSGSGYGYVSVRANPSSPCGLVSNGRAHRVTYGVQQPVISTTSTQRPVNSFAEFSIDGLGLSNIQWIVPGNWTIVNGQGTPDLSVITGNVPDDYLIEVTAESCGTTVANFLEVEVEPNFGGGGTFFRSSGATEKPVTTVGIKEAVSVYPNPVKSVMQVEFQQNTSDIRLLTLTNLADGRKVLEQKPDKDSSIDLSEVDNGVYIMTVILNSGEKIQKRIRVLH